MTQEINHSVDRVDCIVGWDPKNSKLVQEISGAPKIIYDCALHRNTEEYIAWALKNGSLSPDAFLKKYAPKYGDIGAFLDMKHFDPLDAWVSQNIVTLQGKNALNDIMFHGATQITTWYVLIFNTNTTCVNTMTYAVPVFTESTDYTEAVRQTYVEAASSSQITTNTASRAVFTMNGTTTIYGCGLVGGGTDPTVKGNTAGGGTLYSASKFDAAKSVVATNVLSVGISITQA